MVRTCTIMAAALALGGCFLFGVHGDSSSYDAEAQRQAELARQQQQADQELAFQLDSQRPAALAEGASLEQVLAFAETVSAAVRSGAIDRGAVPADVVEQAWAALEQYEAKLADDERPEVGGERAAIEVWRGALLHVVGRHDEAAARWLIAIALEPNLELLRMITELPRSPVVDDAVVQACPLVRPQVSAEALPDFVGSCLVAARDDRAKLGWASAKADLEAYDEEMARRAEAERIRAEQEAALAAERAAETAQAQMWASAAMIAAGRCRFSNCLTDGWELSTDQGTVVTTCRFSNCLTDGWETRFPDGSTATTNCRFSDCFKDGWETRFPDGSTATTSCRFSNCPVDGWETRLPNGDSATTSCRFSDCFKDGWDTRIPGGSVSCSCRFSNCLEDGADCS
jgi:tetratricopeptide (TPR) repeat protein